MRLVIGISGSSGVIYGIRLLEVLRERRDVETHLVISQGAKLNIALETNWKPREVEALADYAYADRDLAAPISSGSFLTAGMIIVPCSIKTLSGVVNSYADNLLVRAADVSLKEGRRLVLVPRESPLHVGHTRLLHEAATLGALICPPMPAFYNAPRTIADLIDHSIGRLLDLFGIDNDLARRWEGPMRTPEEIQVETQVETHTGTHTGIQIGTQIGTQAEIQMGPQASDSRRSGKG